MLLARQFKTRNIPSNIMTFSERHIQFYENCNQNIWSNRIDFH